jgi:phosphatidylglycerol---prolipoprotein diacylglyceryl transferase
VLPKFTWNIDPVLLHVGPLQIRYYSLLFVGVFLGGYALLKWQIERGGGDEEDAGDFIVYGVLGVLIGARLGHVLFYDLHRALTDPIWVFEIWKGGLASHGATAGLVIAMWIFCWRRGIPFLEGADRFSYSAALGATLVRVGNFFNSEIVGRPTPGQNWGIRFPRYDGVLNGPYRYPTQFYEVALGLLVLGSLYVFDRALGKEKRPRGAMISLFFAIYFTGRFFVEFFKAYQTTERFALSSTLSLTMGQYLSIPAALLGFFGLFWSLNRREPVGWVRADDEEFEDEDEEYEDEEDEEDEDEEPEDEEDEDDVEARRRRARARRKAREQRAEHEDDEGEEPPESDGEAPEPPPKKPKKKASPPPDEAAPDDEKESEPSK